MKEFTTNILQRFSLHIHNSKSSPYSAYHPWNRTSRKRIEENTQIIARPYLKNSDAKSAATATKKKPLQRRSKPAILGNVDF